MASEWASNSWRLFSGKNVCSRMRFLVEKLKRVGYNKKGFAFFNLAIESLIGFRNPRPLGVVKVNWLCLEELPGSVGPPWRDMPGRL